MGRSTTYNNITSEEKISLCNKENLQLASDFLEYLSSIDRAKTTIDAYSHDLNIFWCWNMEFNKNKFFVDLSKRDIVKFQNHAINVWKWSPKRTRRVKSTLSSLSNYIENILDDEFDDYRPIVRKIENPVNDTVREKTVFQDAELQSLLDYLVEKQDYYKACTLALAMYSGRRKSELPRFKVSYFEESNVMFGSLYKTPEKVVTKGRGSRGKLLDLYVLKNQFDPYLKLWLQQRKELGIESEWLLPKYKNGEWIDEPISTTTLDSWCKTFTRILGKDFYFHSLRHYFTTSLAKANIPDSIIQEIVGWTSADMVKIYNDTTTDESLGKYFDAGGVKTVVANTLDSL